MRKTIDTISPGNEAIDTWTFTTNTASTIVQDTARSLHGAAISYFHDNADRKSFSPRPRGSFLQQARIKRFEVKNKSPAVRVCCSPEKTNFTVRLQSPGLPKTCIADSYHDVDVNRLIGDSHKQGHL
ncbi:hypothetical protein B0T10DRAFT_463999 [Thelonectria olida]|uniref:Uncharacterized protein n=1 Tax=Thelonectria olida TaxID=1576542 RepID=A0A9P8VVB6_9HYPO|nr:hypothetical protein B0T10DRAFT_463999 [Thelonectria olida]